MALWVRQLPEPEVPPDEARRLAREILAGSEFDEPEPGWLEQVGRALGELFGVLGELLSGAGGVLSVLAWVALAAAVAAVGWLVVRARRRRPPEPEPRVRTRSLEGSRPPEDWASEAERFESEGEWKLALRARYRALVSALIHARQLRDVPGRTTGEYRRELARARTDVGPDFAAASELFEAAWYGDRPTGPGENHRFAEHARRVLEEVAP